MKEAQFSDVPRDWAVCLDEDCPLATTCQRRMFGRLIPADMVEHNVVLPGAWRGDKCQRYVEARPVRIVWGMTKLFAGVKWWEAQEMRWEIMNDIFGGRSQFYRYRRGRWPIPPERQEEIRAVFRRYGYEQEPRYDRVEETYYFPE